MAGFRFRGGLHAPPRYAATRAQHTQIQDNELSSQCSVTGVRSGRTRLSGLLRARHFDGLFGIVNPFWPVVVERLELHGRRGEVRGVKRVERNKAIEDMSCFKSSCASSRSGA